MTRAVITCLGGELHQQQGYHACIMSHLVCRNVIISYFVWLMATRTAKLLPHLWNRPQDIIHVPAFILFGYYFAIMKLYALFTLHEVRFMLLTFYKFFAPSFLTPPLDWLGYSCWYRWPNCSHESSRWRRIGIDGEITSTIYWFSRTTKISVVGSLCSVMTSNIGADLWSSHLVHDHLDFFSWPFSLTMSCFFFPRRYR